MMKVSYEDAINIANNLNTKRLKYHEYRLLIDALQLAEEKRGMLDMLVKMLWDEFGDVPMNPDTERIEEQFLIFKVGTSREEIWHWFDSLYSKGVAFLLYGGD